MSVKIKKSGAWQNIPNDHIYLKEGGYGGGYWLRPAKIYIKEGAFGSPYWIDSGYRGAPAAPTNLRHTSWGYNAQIAVAWDAPVSTVPIQQYHIEVLGWDAVPAWGWHTSPTNFTTPSGYTLANDHDYMIRVRSLSYEGVYSDHNVYQPAGGWSFNNFVPGWVYMRFHIGHPAQYQDVLVTKERSFWKLANVGGGYGNGGYRDTSSHIIIPARVRVDTMYGAFHPTWGAGWVSIPDAARRLYPLRNTDIKWNEGAYYLEPSPWSGYLPWVAEWSNGNTQFGVWTWGDGWSGGGGPYYWTGHVQCWGVEQYDVWESHLVTSEQGNYYW
jgi:hypothetical protein